MTSLRNSVRTSLLFTVFVELGSKMLETPVKMP